MENKLQNIDIQPLAKKIPQLIEQGRSVVAQAVNSTLTVLYWQIGHSINKDLLQFQRADYGKQVVALLARELTLRHGPGWSEKHLRHCIRFAEMYPEGSIISTVWRQLTWSHFTDFYLQMAQLEHWSVRILQERIQSMLYERTTTINHPHHVQNQRHRTSKTWSKRPG